MKRTLSILFFALCLMSVLLSALAYSYDDPALASYEVTAPSRQRLVYMYAKPSSSGNPVSTYYNGTVLKMIDLNASKTYSFVIGPDGKEGYVRREWLTQILDYSYDDETLEEYRVIADRRSVYMFPVASDSGEPNASYARDAVLKMIDYDADSTYCFVIGPDGKCGYIRKVYLMKVYDYEDEQYAAYRVTSTYSTGYLYMYPDPSSDHNPLATYYNDTVLKVIDYESDETYCLAVGPDGTAGYVRKSQLTAETDSGSLGPVFEVFSTRSYVYMYAKPNSGSTNLGRYNNGEQIEIIDWGADKNYAFVRGVKDNKYGYIQKKSLHPSSVNPVKGYMKIESPYNTFVYLYEKASNGSKNLGRYSNGEQVGILDWNASADYALVYTADEKIGYIQKTCLVSLFS